MQLTASFCNENEGLEFEAASPKDFSSIPAPDSILTYHELMHKLDEIPFRRDWAFRQHGFDRRIIQAPWANKKFDESIGIKIFGVTSVLLILKRLPDIGLLINL